MPTPLFCPLAPDWVVIAGVVGAFAGLVAAIGTLWAAWGVQAIAKRDRQHRDAVRLESTFRAVVQYMPEFVTALYQLRGFARRPRYTEAPGGLEGLAVGLFAQRMRHEFLSIEIATITQRRGSEGLGVNAAAAVAHAENVVRRAQVPFQDGGAKASLEAWRMVNAIADAAAEVSPWVEAAASKLYRVQGTGGVPPWELPEIPILEVPRAGTNQ